MVDLKQPDYAIYSVDLPVCKKKVEFRPWNMKEHKILLMAYASGDRAEVRRATRQIITNCVHGEINVRALPVADMELLFLRLRTRSVGETSQLTLRNEHTDEVKRIDLDLTKVQVQISKDRDLKVTLVDDDKKPTGLYFIMKEPTVAIMEEVTALKNADPGALEELEIAARCVDRICDAESQSPGSDDPEQAKKIRSIMENLSPKRFEGIDRFLEGVPRLYHEIELSTVFPGMKGKYKIEGLEAFFE